jgi:hypothetical protein
MKEIIDRCVAGASVLSLCELGDNRVLEETGRVFKKDKEMKKGKSCWLRKKKVNAEIQVII